MTLFNTKQKALYNNPTKVKLLKFLEKPKQKRVKKI